MLLMCRVSKSADPDQTRRRRRCGWSGSTLFAYVRTSLFAWLWPNSMSSNNYVNADRFETPEFQFILGESSITRVTSQKLLGVHIDDNLSWKVHIDKTCAKLISKLYLLKRINGVLHFEMKTGSTIQCIHNSIFFLLWEQYLETWQSFWY